MSAASERAVACAGCGTSWTAPVRACPTCGKRSEDAYLRSTVANAKRLDEAMAEVYPASEREALLKAFGVSNGAQVWLEFQGGPDEMLATLHAAGFYRPTPRTVTTVEDLNDRRWLNHVLVDCAGLVWHRWASGWYCAAPEQHEGSGPALPATVLAPAIDPDDEALVERGAEAFEETWNGGIQDFNPETDDYDAYIRMCIRAALKEVSRG